ncbi:MAG: glycosyltransferase family 4 protein [Candidatus Krumholzibacteriota bacterium]|nr:glycosyltransferase family 4 protein [Candidatus Krumholzibacteriota bacterium]
MNNRARLSIAMIGAKGLPALFGGIERHVEEIGLRLADRGHRVVVFGRRPFGAVDGHRGMELRVLPSIPTKNLETATNAFAASLAAAVGPYDIVHYHGIGPSLFCPIPRIAGRRTVATIHALDYRQSKWGRAAKFLLRRGEAVAATRADAVIAVSRIIAQLVRDRYKRTADYVPNGTTLRETPPFREAAAMRIEPGRYILSVGRFIVERGFHTLIEAFSAVETDCRLVIVGDERFERRYAARLRACADDRVLFPGFISGPLLDELYGHCALYVLPSLVEGLPISLIEAMGYSRPLLASDIPENVEVAGGIAAFFRRGDATDLARALGELLAMPVDERLATGASGRSRVAERYDWDRIADQIEEIYYRVAQPSS